MIALFGVSKLLVMEKCIFLPQEWNVQFQADFHYQPTAFKPISVLWWILYSSKRESLGDHPVKLTLIYICGLPRIIKPYFHESVFIQFMLIFEQG